MNTFLIIGLVGFAAALISNLVVLFGFSLFGVSKPEAAFFTNGWWSTWFPIYPVWLVFTIIGIRQKLSRKSTKEKSDSG